MQRWRFCCTFRLAQSKPIFTVAGRPLRHFCRSRKVQTSPHLRIVVSVRVPTLAADSALSGYLPCFAPLTDYPTSCPTPSRDIGSNVSAFKIPNGLPPVVPRCGADRGQKEQDTAVRDVPRATLHVCFPTGGGPPET